MGYVISPRPLSPRWRRGGLGFNCAPQRRCCLRKRECVWAQMYVFEFPGGNCSDWDGGFLVPGRLTLCEEGSIIGAMRPWLDIQTKLLRFARAIIAAGK